MNDLPKCVFVACRRQRPQQQPPPAAQSRRRCAAAAAERLGFADEERSPSLPARPTCLSPPPPSRLPPPGR
eukprot:362589-Chlamydomonas_euryale.AAC.4